MKNRAFTLIELLTVIAVIALLLAIIMPSLMQAKEQARGVYCLNNLKQMSVAASAYTSDFNNTYPLAQYTMSVSFALAGDGGSGPDTHISLIQPPDEQQTETIFYQYCWDFTRIVRGESEEIIPGLLWQGDTAVQVNQCPSYKGCDNWMSSPFSGYNYNTSYIGHGQDERVDRSKYRGEVIAHPSLPYVQIVMPAGTDQVRYPSGCALFGDGQYSGGANKFMRSPWAWEGDCDILIRQGGTQGYRHNGKTNVAWCDGHVSVFEDRYIDCHPSIQSQLKSYNDKNKIKIGFLSSDNSAYDLR